MVTPPMAKSASESHGRMDVDTANAGGNKVNHVFEYVPMKHRRPAKVELKGSFDDWRSRYEMHWSPEKKSYVLPLSLPPGKHTYKFIVDSMWTCAYTKPKDEDRHGNITNVVTIRPDGQAV